MKHIFPQLISKKTFLKLKEKTNDLFQTSRELVTLISPYTQSKSIYLSTSKVNILVISYVVLFVLKIK